MIAHLKSQWVNLASQYFEDQHIISSHWNEIVTQYSHKNRYYHNLLHLNAMFSHLNDFEEIINDIDTLKFAIWYHDIIYKSTKKDNEEKSASLAQKRLKSSKLDENCLKKLQKLIISTKKHELKLTDNHDNAYLLDLDLSILGSSWEMYKTYVQNIRKEYKIYPAFIYNPGRKKVLLHFLDRKSLFFTEQFKMKYEAQARENLKKEIDLL